MAGTEVEDLKRIVSKLEADLKKALIERAAFEADVVMIRPALEACHNAAKNTGAPTHMSTPSWIRCLDQERGDLRAMLNRRTDVEAERDQLRAELADLKTTIAYAPVVPDSLAEPVTQKRYNALVLQLECYKATRKFWPLHLREALEANDLAAVTKETERAEAVVAEWHKGYSELKRVRGVLKSLESFAEDIFNKADNALGLIEEELDDELDDVPDEVTLSTSVDELDLSVRVANDLERRHIKTIGALVQLTREELLENCKPRHIDELETELANFGVALYKKPPQQAETLGAPIFVGEVNRPEYLAAPDPNFTTISKRDLRCLMDAVALHTGTKGFVAAVDALNAEGGFGDYQQYLHWHAHWHALREQINKTAIEVLAKKDELLK